MNIEKVFRAVYTHNVDQMAQAIRRGVDVNAVNEDGASLLHEASFVGAAPIVEMLIKAGASLSMKTPDGDTALILAISSRGLAQKEAVEIASFDDIAPVDRISWSAAMGDAVKTATLLLDAGVSVDERGANGWTPLMVAIQDRQSDLAHLLLQRGADASLLSEDRVSPFTLAQRRRRSMPDVFEAIQATMPTQLDMLSAFDGTQEPRRPKV